MNQLKKKYLSKEDAIARAQKYCAWQERCHQEVKGKLLEWGIRGHDVEEIIAGLIEQSFLNEERFARAYARGKFRMKKWGRIKIAQALKHKNISEYCMNKGFEEIDEGEYKKTMQSLIEQKSDAVDIENPYQKNAKVAAYVINKGYEPALVWSFLKSDD